MTKNIFGSYNLSIKEIQYQNDLTGTGQFRLGNRYPSEIGLNGTGKSSYRISGPTLSKTQVPTASRLLDSQRKPQQSRITILIISLQQGCGYGSGRIWVFWSEPC